MAAERKLKTAAERRAVNGRDHRLRTILDGVDDVMQTWRLRRLAELRNVGTGDERASRAHDHDGLDARIRDRAVHAVDNTLSHRSTQRVDRRAVDCDDGNCVMTFHLDHLAHANSP